MTKAEELLAQALAIPFEKVKPPEPPKLTVVTRNDDPRWLRARARQAARDAAEAEARERERLERKQADREAAWERKRAAFEAAHYHEVERRFHEQQAQEYRGFHSRGD
jgi:hypothetical protein